MKKLLIIFFYTILFITLSLIIMFIKDGAHPPYNAHNIKHWQEPIQTNLSGTYGKKFMYGRIRYMAEFEINARVLGKKYYDNGRYSEISPMDLSLGWKYMSHPKVYKKLKMVNNNRWFYWGGSLIIPKEEAMRNHANIHIIPANKDILKKLKSLQVEDLVSLKGYLVNYDELASFYIFSITTSLSRLDTDHNSGEVLYVEYVETY